MSRTTPSTPASGAATARDPRAEILEAATALLSEGGWEGLTIRRLALRSGYTSPAIYHEFGDKAGLVDAILERAFDRLVERLERLPWSDDPRERMRLNFREIVRFGREQPTHYRLMESLHPEKESKIRSAEAARLRLEEPLDTLAAALDDVERIRQSMWALLHGLISLPASRRDVDWCEGLEDTAFEAMLVGLLGRSGEPR
jgi:AcrR family transcriptional regulator